ncbi:MAG TPA: hypothetical protein VMD59_03820, partial [Acidimicrobiales bacterium]|nr:hypothetical protein [Acidimicrobiales bacterium]
PMVATFTNSSFEPSEELGLPKGATGQGELNSVWCTASAACSVVGTYDSTYFGAESLEEYQYKGGWWDLSVPMNGNAKVLADDDNVSLSSVACWGPGDCATVGEITTPKGAVEAVEAMTGPPGPSEVLKNGQGPGHPAPLPSPSGSHRSEPPA